MRTETITHPPTSVAFLEAQTAARQRLAANPGLVKVFVACERTGNVNTYRQPRKK